MTSRVARRGHNVLHCLQFHEDRTSVYFLERACRFFLSAYVFFFFDFSIVFSSPLPHFFGMNVLGRHIRWGWSFVRLFVLSQVYYKFLFEVLLGCLAAGTSEFGLEEARYGGAGA